MEKIESSNTMRETDGHRLLDCYRIALDYGEQAGHLAVEQFKLQTEKSPTDKTQSNT